MYYVLTLKLDRYTINSSYNNYELLKIGIAKNKIYVYKICECHVPSIYKNIKKSYNL